MPDILYLIARWWKQILTIMILSLVTVGAIVYFLPEKYMSVATALPANPVISDKARVFGKNVQALYPSIGTEEELDIILGTAQLDTAYLAVVTQFNLWDHYKMGEKGDAAIPKATYLLRENSSVTKSGYGELKIRVWDTDKNLAPQLANAIAAQLNLIHQGLQNENNKAILNKLKELITIKRSSKDSIGSKNDEQIKEYEKLADEYQLMIDMVPAALVTVEKARPSPWPDKPKHALILTATAVLSFLFALLVALALEKRKKRM